MNERGKGVADDRTARAFEGLVDFLSRNPGLAQALVWDHRPDDFGRCSAGCRAGGDQSSVVRHPCTTAECATSALYRICKPSPEQGLPHQVDRAE